MRFRLLRIITCFPECAVRCNENIHKFDILLMLILLAFEYTHIYVGYLETPTSSKRIECASNVNTYSQHNMYLLLFINIHF